MKLLCTDMDRTLLPNGEQPENPHARPILWKLLKTHDVTLAYVTGRDLGRALKGIAQYQLPVPDFIVGDVGTSVYQQLDGEWQQNTHWQNAIASDWQERDGAFVHSLLADVDLLQAQEPDRQSRFKQSYCFNSTIDEAQLRTTVQQRLDAEGMDASLVISHDPIKQVGLLDVLPRSATKSGAVTFLQTLLKLPANEVLFAGDSGNDVEAICGPQMAVLVANADDPTCQAVRRFMSDSTDSQGILMAQGGVPVKDHDALNGNYAAGIVEGLLHFCPAWQTHLQDADWLQDAI